MLVGVPKEIKNHEYRVGLTPAAVQELVHHGHQVLVEKNGGASIGFSDDLYERAGASIANTAAEIFQRVDMIVKVKEPQSVERAMLKEGQVLFTYLHLAPDEPQTRELMQSRATCIAYETVTDDNGQLPLLAPMSEVAGRMSIQAGAHCLEKYKGGRGVLLGGVPGVEPGHVVIVGGGVVGENATAMAVGMGADVTVLDRSVDVLRRLDARFGNRIQTQFSTKAALEELAVKADMVVGAVLIPGASAPKLISRELISRMKPGSAIVDVAIDQGGCCETSRPTTHADPIYMVDDVVHYCVANMPGAVARTSTLALNNATLPYVLALANKGAGQAMREDPHLMNGLNVCQGKVTCKEVSEARDIPYTDPASLVMDI